MATAVRLASARVWLYRSIILRLRCPARDMIVASEACDSASRLTDVWRMSCQRQSTFAAVRAAVHATFQDPIGFVGSVA
jgi:hypothetical protein